MKIEEMNLTEKSYLVGAMEWLKQQPEMKDLPITDERSIFYHVAPLKYAELLARFYMTNLADKP